MWVVKNKSSDKSTRVAKVKTHKQKKFENNKCWQGCSPLNVACGNAIKKHFDGSSEA